MGKKKLTENQENDIIKKYSIDKLEIREISEIIGESLSFVRSILKRKNIKLRTARLFEFENKKYLYGCHHNYFENIDSQEKAYFLGFLYTDGSVDNKSRARVTLSLQEGDRELLERLNKLINIDRPLGFINLNSKNPNHQNAVVLCVSSYKVVRDLENHGCMNNKTFDLRWPQNIEEEFIPHFVRGLWDGDGSIGHSHGNVSFTGTLNMCQNIQAIVKRKFNIHAGIYLSGFDPEKTIRELRIGGRKQCRLFLNWIYNNSTIHLERKYISSQLIINYVPKENPRILKHENGERFSEEDKKERQRIKDKVRSVQRTAKRRASLPIEKHRYKK